MSPKEKAVEALRRIVGIASGVQYSGSPLRSDYRAISVADCLQAGELLHLLAPSEPEGERGEDVERLRAALPPPAAPDADLVEVAARWLCRQSFLRQWAGRLERQEQLDRSVDNVWPEYKVEAAELLSTILPLIEQAAKAEEREACAKVSEKLPKKMVADYSCVVEMDATAEDAAFAIRQRGAPESGDG